MNKKETSGLDQLTQVLDYILNQANAVEFDVIIKACHRRIKDTARDRSGIANPLRDSRSLSLQLDTSIQKTMQSLRHQAQGIMSHIVKKEVPGISETQLSALWAELNATEPDTAKAQSLPSQAVLSMVRDFIAYSTGLMPPTRQLELWQLSSDWKKKYWSSFSPEIKALIKSYLEGTIEITIFEKALLSILEL